ncbi:retinoid-inducible serine carboxypeptidase-like [Diabrotica undecimpunctata]|uniref:retinoid-inducible serine carboxypeptidase-like n=1 Tax=Diabrotica undecimpunctata TaxID=50387 RepID=UPI003B63EB71
MLSVTLILLLFELTFAKTGFGPGEQDWGYATVREKGHIFWWLYYTSANVSHPTERPLIIWLQGGPGGSSTAIGNFVELGPLDKDLNVRNTTWVQHANVLFVDNPVGTGFSYLDDGGVFAQNNTEIARDFIDFLIQFYNKLPSFRTVPLYIFGESYGGKMTVEIAVELDKAIKEKQIQASFKGIALGDSWIAPIDYVFTWAPYLFNLGLIDEKGVDQINSIALKVQKSYEDGDYNISTDYWALAELQIVNETGNVDFYNVLKKINTDPNFVNEDLHYSYLNKILDEVKKTLKLKAKGVADSSPVFEALSNDFMKPVTDLVETLLNSTNITVTVYNGQLDLITDTPGTLKWINNISFKDKDLWKKSERKPFVVNGIIEGFVKKYRNFGLYWVNRAGHMVQKDNPSAMHYILKCVTNNFVV